MTWPRCCEGRKAVAGPDPLDRWAIQCADCGRILAVVDGPRDEVFADL